MKNNLTMAEIAQAEQISGVSITRLFNFDEPNSKLMAAVAWLILRRENKEIRFEEFESTTTYAECVDIITDDDSEEQKK